MIHSSAIIDKNAKLYNNVKIGAYSKIGPNVVIGQNSIIHSHVVIEGNTQIGENCEVFPFTVIGTRSQDLSIKPDFIGNVTINDNVTIREQVTIHSSTKMNTSTAIGKNCFFMATSHVAHDCVLGENVIMANSSMLAGHTTIGSNVFISGGAAIHQFTKVGDYSFIIATSRTVQDVPPFSMTAGSSPTEFAGLNIVGLRRAGFSQEDRTLIKKAYKILYNNGIKNSKSLSTLENWEYKSHPAVKYIIDFVKSSKRGIIRKWQGRKS